jgi:hypothetical protein
MDNAQSLLRRTADLERLSGKSNTQEIAKTIDSGTAFPSSPVDGQPFYRSDRQILYCYNSTAVAWLSLHEYAIPLPAATTAGATANFTATRRAMRRDYFLYLTRAEFIVDTGATNGGANNWTVRVQRNDDAGANINTAAISTSTLAVSTTDQVLTDTGLSQSAVLYKNLFLRAVITGAPTNITFFATVYCRLIG